MNTMKKSLTKTNPAIKTVLAPNAPWPKWEKTPAVKRKSKNQSKIKMQELVLDYFAEARNEIEMAKTSTKHRARDRLSGRFASIK